MSIVLLFWLVIGVSSCFALSGLFSLDCLLFGVCYLLGCLWYVVLRCLVGIGSGFVYCVVSIKFMCLLQLCGLAFCSVFRCYLVYW